MVFKLFIQVILAVWIKGDLSTAGQACRIRGALWTLKTCLNANLIWAAGYDSTPCIHQKFYGLNTYIFE